MKDKKEDNTDSGLKRRYLAGEPTASIANSLGLGTRATEKRLKKLGLELRWGKTVWSPHDAGIVARYRAGESTKSIGESLGIKGNAVRKRLRKLGVRLRGSKPLPDTIEVREWLARPRPELLSEAERSLLKLVETMLPSKTMEEIRSKVGLSRRGLERLMRTGGVRKDGSAIARRRAVYSKRGGLKFKALYSLPPERKLETCRRRNKTRPPQNRSDLRRRNRDAIISWLGGACLCGYDHPPSLICATRSGSLHPMSGFLLNPKRCKNGLRWYRLYCPKCWAALEKILVKEWMPGMPRTKLGPLQNNMTGSHTKPFRNPRRREGRLEG